MRSARWAHVAAVVAIAGGAVAAPTPPSELPPSDEPAALPDLPASAPAKFAVAPFENHSNVKSLDWVIAGAPFEIAEKTQQVLGLDATGGPLAVGAPIDATPAAAAALATRTGATWVVTGWFERPNWQLALHVRMWKVVGGIAVDAADAARTEDPATYHAMIGALLGEVWGHVGVAISPAQLALLARPLAPDLYAVTLMGRGLGHLGGALGAIDLKAAQHDLERATFIDPKLYEAQRLLGELELVQAPGDAKAAARAAGKFNYAHDLAPDDVESLRASAYAAAIADKHDLALELFHALVAARPWDLDARYQLGAALWATGDASAAEHQLEQVTARAPDLLPARRVLALIHASRSDTPKLVAQLEAIAARAPNDLDVKADLATAYGALGAWRKAVAQLETIAAARPNDLALLVRVGDGERRAGDLDAALAWYARAGKLAPESSWPGFATAQALFDAGRLPDAIRAYTALQKFKDDLPAADEALGAIALMQGRADDAAALLRRAVHDAPRELITRRVAITAELARHDPDAALAQLEPALAAWPGDGELHYLAGIAHADAGDRAAARSELAAAPEVARARQAIHTLDAGGTIALELQPTLVRPWGDAEALTAALDRYAVTATAMTAIRIAYQTSVLKLIGAVGKGPLAHGKGATTCVLAEMAPPWAAAQAALASYARLGVELQATWRFVARHDDAGATAGLLPAARTAVAADKKAFRTAIADVNELRTEWSRGVEPELRAVGCNDKLLAAAIADPQRYQKIVEDTAEKIPTHTAPRARPRATFFVDNTDCPDPVDVWVDGAPLGTVAPGRRSALVGDGGERTLCLELPGAAACGDRGTVREVYLHDGWSVTMHCPK